MPHHHPALFFIIISYFDREFNLMITRDSKKPPKKELYNLTALFFT